mmetsp:Transcript_12514/g.19365  ORF Transcript_12514/g.19365 Transcript_12514/m.19365 type:complete len:358 (-) Transcript_12514:2428-3501(-)
MKSSKMMLAEVASSSSDDDDDSSTSSSSSSSLSGAHSNDPQMTKIESLDDLPSDDSVSLGESSDEDDDSDDEERQDQNDENSDSEFSDGNDQSDDEDMPLEERVSRKRNEGISEKSRKDRMGRKQAALQKASKALAAFNAKKDKKQAGDKEFKAISSKSKHKPTEVSSKRTDFYKRGAPQLNSSGIGVEIGAHTYKPRDPRMENMAGHFNADHFDRNYAFLDDMRKEEIDRLKKRISARSMHGKKGQKARRKLGISVDEHAAQYDKDELQRLTQEKSAIQKNQVETAAKRAVKKKIRQGVADGTHGAYYPKRRELKKMELEAKFDELRKRGGDSAVDKAVAKRRKKNKSKDVGLFNK